MTIAACSPTPITPGVVVFNATEFTGLYPAFVTVPAATLQNNFNMATVQLNNSCCSVVQDAPTRQWLLYLLTAHITALLNGVNGQPPSGAVGRVSSATEGSATAQLEYSSTVTDSQAYYIQTPWGAQFWQSTLPYRTARYVAPCNDWAGIGNMSAWDAWPQ